MMDNTSDPVGMLKPRAPLLAPLALLGAVSLTAGLTAYRVWPARRAAAGSTRKRQALIAYLRDHLGGSDVALRVLHRLSLDASGHRGRDVVPAIVQGV